MSGAGNVNNGRARVSFRQSGLLVLVSINTICVTLDKSFCLFEPQFPKWKRYLTLVLLTTCGLFFPSSGLEVGTVLTFCSCVFTSVSLYNSLSC